MPIREFPGSGERCACYVPRVTARRCMSHRCANLDAVDYPVWQPCLSPYVWEAPGAMPAHRHQCGCWWPHPQGSTLSFPSAAGLRVFPIAALPFSFTEIICNVIILLGSAASSQPMRALGFMEFSKRRDGWKGAPTASANGGQAPANLELGVSSHAALKAKTRLLALASGKKRMRKGLWRSGGE